MLLLSHFSCVQLYAVLWTLACQVPLSVGFSRQEYWSGLPCPPPEDLPDPGIKPGSLALQADSLPLTLQGNPCVYRISPVFWISFPFRSPQSTEFPVLYSRFSLVTYFIHSSVFISVPISQFIPPIFSLPVSVYVFCISVSQFLLCKFVCIMLLNSTCKQYYTIFIFLWFISLCMTVSRSIHISSNCIVFFIFMAD